MRHGVPPGLAQRPLSTGAAAQVAGVHSTTIWRAIREGELPASRLGPHGHYRIAREKLEEWLRQPTSPDEPEEAA